jgi:hypothetical protein
MYNPHLCAERAVQALRRWITANAALYEALLAAGYAKSRHSYTPREVKLRRTYATEGVHGRHYPFLHRTHVNRTKGLFPYPPVPYFFGMNLVSLFKRLITFVAIVCNYLNNTPIYQKYYVFNRS